jgi:hypothetical protein
MHQHDIEGGKTSIFREMADPSLVLFKGRYFLFASMTKGFYHSDDLVRWEYKETLELPPCDYAPDAREIDGSLYVCAGSWVKNYFYRSEDPLRIPFERIPTSLSFLDPNLFQDDDGRVYLYYGSSDRTPIWGVELDRKTMEPIGEKTALIEGRPESHGWERCAENNDLRLQVKSPHLTGGPFIEGAWMTKHGGKYYLQYSAPHTAYNVYSDGVYTSDKPLGPFTYAAHNPVSSKPGGFITGAGHGSTFCDKFGNWWHIATMRISVNHMFERRIGLFPAGFDQDGVFFVNQRLADYPISVPPSKREPWEASAGWMLLSYKKHVTASSHANGCGPENAVNEDARDYWMAADPSPGQHITVDLSVEMDVFAVQLNLGDHQIAPQGIPEEKFEQVFSKRFIDIGCPAAEFMVEASKDGITWEILKDTRGSLDDHNHEYIELEQSKKIRFVRCVGLRMPYGMPFTVSGLRIFGKGCGQLPAKASASGRMSGELDAAISWEAAKGAIGYNVSYGIEKDKLYSCWTLYEKTHLSLGMLSKGQRYYAQVDSFNENGTTPGDVFEIL